MKLIVGVSDMKVSSNKDDVLITYSLGSCIGVVIYDPKTRVGGML
ncbi:MAG: chemotaxis protein CheD, partial [Desulfobacteraceae bacterium]|nr:chemotaxis protein CheD [Desulfobacteraceae bacterium]